MQDTLRISRGPGDNEEEVLEKISRERFIRLGTTLGVGAACASLVACGGGAGGSGGGNSGDGDSGGGSYGGGNSGGGGSKKSSGGEAKAGGTAIASESEVAPGSAYKFKDSGNPAFLVHLDTGDFVAYSAPRPLPEIPVKVEGGEVVKA